MLNHLPMHPNHVISLAALGFFHPCVWQCSRIFHCSSDTHHRNGSARRDVVSLMVYGSSYLSGGPLGDCVSFDVVNALLLGAPACRPLAHGAVVTTSPDGGAGVLVAHGARVG